MKRTFKRSRHLTFSSSTARNLVEGPGGRVPPNARVVSIGPITSRAARDAGLDVAVEAEGQDIEGLLATLLTDAGF